MTRNVKPPEERRQELIDVSSKLFFEKGYDHTSVRDILREVNGAPGMFYYYFKSKDEIYHEVMQQHIQNYIVSLVHIYSNKELSISMRIGLIIEKLKETFMLSLGAIDKTNSPDNQGFLMTIKQCILNCNVEQVTNLLNEAIETGFTKKEDMATPDTKACSLFIIYGIYGLLNDGDITKVTMENVEHRLSQIPVLVSHILGIPVEKLLPSNRE